MLLNNNKTINNIGFGTWKLSKEKTQESVFNALKCGYRLIDTASSYGNELEIGKAIKESDIDRNEIFVSGKLWNTDRKYDDVISACKRTIELLQCDYLDSYLIHWPHSKSLYNNWKELNNETWKAFEYLYENGYVKSIGVCNFKIEHLKSLLCNINPMINQIEFHIGYCQSELVDYCKRNNIVVEAWSPLGSGKLLKKEQLLEIANKYNISIAELCVAYCSNKGVIPLPKSSNYERMCNNLNSIQIKLEKEDIELLDNVQRMGYSGLDPDTLTLFG